MAPLGFCNVSTAAGFMQVPGSGVCVAAARAAGVRFREACGGALFGLVEELRCWSAGEGVLLGLSFRGSVAAGVFPVVPIVEVEGWSITLAGCTGG